MHVKTLALACAAAALLTAAGAMPAAATPDKPVIALSNAYFGNTWRHQMVDAFEAAAKKAKEDGKIADYIILNGDGTVAQQNSQIAELILKKVDAIAVDAASETAVNGIIEKACKAGIKVVSFDSIASAPCNYQLNFDFKGYKKEQAEWVLKKIGGKGNIIVVRGVKGSAPDADMYSAQEAVLKANPDVKVVRDRLWPGDRLGGAVGGGERAAEPAACRCRARPGRQRRYRHRPGVRPVWRRLCQEDAGHRGRRQLQLHPVVDRSSARRTAIPPSR